LRLKSLELQGFKSFPDKSVISFDQGITAIVGPNGSGKSNISDAVRWVLGEQSTRTLRGSKMEDVIFGGTQQRKPVGFAEVSLTIDNSDGALPVEYNEVTVTRRYYRSGESEFYINRKAMRLRDIHELFMDTGLGRDGYSIIGQGRIDEILSVKSEDRREIFEEASGISKFRHRKAEAERKLDATEENLIRIRDIISELEGQVVPLQEQAEKAKRFLAIYDELKKLETNVWLYELGREKELARKLAQDYEIACAQLSRAQETVDGLYREMEEQSEKMRALEVALEEERERMQASERATQEIIHARQVLEATVQNNLENAERVRNELSEEASREGGMNEQIAERDARIEALHAESVALTESIGGMNEKIRAAMESGNDVRAQLDGLRASLMVKEAELSALCAKQTAEAVALQNEESRLSLLEADFEEHEAKRKETREKARAVKAIAEEAEMKLAEAENRLRGFTLKAESRKEKLESAQTTLQKEQSTLNTLEEKYRYLTELEREFAGYSGATKAVMQASEQKQLQGICGIVSKLMEVPDEYAVAVEIALGGALNNIVVEDERSAKAGISYLKSSGAGRTTFYPLTTIRGKKLSVSLGKEDGVCGIASELISFDKRFSEVYQSLLGRVVIVENIDRAGVLARKNNYQFKIVTLDGQVINAGGSYTGGSVGKNVGILSRANECRRIKEEAQKMREKLEADEISLQELSREYASLTYEIEVAQNDKRAAEDALLKSKTEIEHYDLLLSTMSEAFDNAEEETVQLRASVTVKKREAEALAAEIAEKTAEKDKLTAEIEEKQSGHNDLLSQHGDLTETLAEMKLRAASIEAEVRENERSRAELAELSAAMAGDRSQKLKLIESFEEKNLELQAEIEQKQVEIGESERATEAVRAKISERMQEKLELEAVRNRMDHDVKEQYETIGKLENERARLESKRDGAEQSYTQLIDKLWETYELTVTAAEEAAEPLESIPDAKARIQVLKNERKGLGNVNVGAIEEYDRVAERFEFMSVQRADLEQAKTELLEKIKELTDQMRVIFAEKFAVINQKFGETFTEIFDGGSAELSLEDPDDILNCGIEIKVQPPGKTLKTITLLSGGERAFVAIALYFAIMKVRPTPFCVLDEIEAALDDVNVVRYADYLRRLCDRTQFIVITHRRGTMEEADVLYGVTMQERGISKMLTISMAEVEKELHMKLK